MIEDSSSKYVGNYRQKGLFHIFRGNLDFFLVTLWKAIFNFVECSFVCVQTTVQ